MSEMLREERYLTDRQIAARYGVNRSTPWKWAKRGHFPAPVRLSEQCVRWRESDIAAWERSRERVA